MENHNEEWPLSTCPKCGENVYLTATHNVRNDKWTVLPINVEPTLNGDFVIDLAEYHSAVDILGNNQGDFPIAIYTPGNGEYRPHNPSHYLESGDDDRDSLGLLSPNPASLSSRAGGLPGFEWLGHNSKSGNSYATNGPARIMCHMTVGMGLSKSYVVNHGSPPQLWVNPYTHDKWQTLSMDVAGYALYQPQFGSSDAWTNRHGYTIQIEIVGVPVVNEQTYTDAQNRWIGEEVIAPIIKWFRDNDIPFDTGLVRRVTNSSGSASENWHGRMSERESVETGGTVQHIVEWANDHWDCSVERIDLWVKYALDKLGGVTPPPKPKYNSVKDYDMFIMWNKKGAILIAPGYQRWLNGDEVNALSKIPGMVNYVTQNDSEFGLIGSATFHGQTSLNNPTVADIQRMLGEARNYAGGSEQQGIAANRRLDATQTKLDAIAKDLKDLLESLDPPLPTESVPGGAVPPCDG